MLQEDEGVEFTDDRYQSNLPMHARCTASQAVKNNLRNTELMADKNLIHCQLKVIVREIYFCRVTFAGIST